MVISDDGEFVGREAVLAPNQEVAEVAASDESLRALELILEPDDLAIRDAETPVHAVGLGRVAAVCERWT